MKSGIYYIINTIDGKKYFGSTINLQARKQTHWQTLKTNKHANSYLQNAWNKYGEINFKFKIIQFCNKNDLIINEQKFLDTNFNDGKKLGYNICQIAGNSLGCIRSPETRAKLKIISSQRSPETIEKMRQAKLGKIISQTHKDNIRKARLGTKLSDITKQKLSDIKKGKPFSEEHKKNMSLCRLGKPLSEEVKKNMSIARQGHVVSDETKMKISIAKSGKNHQYFGKHLSEEHRKNISKSLQNMSLETKQKMSKSRRGNKHYNFGKHLSDETKRKISETKLKNKFRSQNE